MLLYKSFLYAVACVLIDDLIFCVQALEAFTMIDHILTEEVQALPTLSLYATVQYITSLVPSPRRPKTDRSVCLFTGS